MRDNLPDIRLTNKYGPNIIAIWIQRVWATKTRYATLRDNLTWLKIKHRTLWFDAKAVRK